MIIGQRQSAQIEKPILKKKDLKEKMKELSSRITSTRSPYKNVLPITINAEPFSFGTP